MQSVLEAAVCQSAVSERKDELSFLFVLVALSVRKGTQAVRLGEQTEWGRLENKEVKGAASYIISTPIFFVPRLTDAGAVSSARPLIVSWTVLSSRIVPYF